jgi:hypothetical protein
VKENTNRGRVTFYGTSDMQKLTCLCDFSGTTEILTCTYKKADMKRIFAIIFLFALLGACTNAQNNANTILAKGNPPLTPVLVDQMQLFFEWALDGKFKETERRTLTQLLIAEWKSGKQSEINETLKLMAIPGSLDKLDADIQKALHDTIQAGLIDQIQKNPGDTLLKLLAEVRKSGDVLNQTSSGVIPSRTSPAQTATASNLAGEWLYRIRGSSITYTDGVGGYADPGGELSGYKLRADGTYEHGYLLSSSVYSCNTRVFGHETGTWKIDGDKLVFKDKTATITSTDNCNKSGNYVKKRELGNYYYKFRLERDEYGLKIAFLKTDGNRDEYYKQDPGRMGW